MYKYAILFECKVVLKSNSVFWKHQFVAPENLAHLTRLLRNSFLGKNLTFISIENLSGRALARSYVYSFRNTREEGEVR